MEKLAELLVLLSILPCGYAMVFSVLRVGGYVDELEDKGTAGYNARTTRKEVAPDNVLKH